MSRPLIEASDVGDVTIVRFIDRSILDMMVIDEIGAKLYELVNDFNRIQILISFKGVDFVSSWMIGKLTALNGTLKGRKGKLILCDVKKSLLEIFELTGLNRIIPIAPDEETGLKAF